MKNRLIYRLILFGGSLSSLSGIMEAKAQVKLVEASAAYRQLKPVISPVFERPAKGFVSSLPAENWEHALLTGNGIMGAMVVGEPYQETVILSHADLYLPQKRSGKTFDQRPELQKIKGLLLAGKYKEAADIPQDLRTAQGYTDQRDPFIPAFDVKLDQQPLQTKAYQRSVNFETGEAVTQWMDETGKYVRKVFVSRADSVIVLSLKGIGKINCKISFGPRPITAEQSAFVKDGVKLMSSVTDGNWLIFNSEFSHLYPGSLTGYAGAGRLIQTGGTVVSLADGLVVSDADEVLLLIKIIPSKGTWNDPVLQLKSYLSALQKLSYEELLKRHEVIHGKLFRQVQLDLNGDQAERELTAEAAIQQGDSIVSPALIERVFDAGRYNMISACGVSAPNLQGLWSGTWAGPWSAGFTTDGNLPVAISMLLPGHTPELMEGFFRLHEKLIPDYRKQAELLYGSRGIHVPAQLTTRGVETDFNDTWCLTYWTGAAGWTANIFYDYYAYTQDADFLRKRAYPFMKEAALFYEDFLQPGNDGKLLFIPSYSPENNPADTDSQAAVNATMDVMITKQLLRNCIKTAELLKTDSGKVKLWKEMLLKMPAFEVSKNGVLKEWIWPGMEENYSHRHASQLYAFYDGVPADFKGDFELQKAAQKLVDRKMDFRKKEGGGEMAFGLVQLGLSAAQLGNSAQAEQLLNWLASKYWTRGMGSYHNVKSLFNTDISGGLPYLVTQLLCTADNDEILLFPAKPVSWKKGRIMGLLLKGNITLNSLSWDEDAAEISLISLVRKRVLVRLKDHEKWIDLKAGERQFVKF